MNLLRTQHYGFQSESQRGNLIQGICWKPIEEVAMSEPSEGVRRKPIEEVAMSEPSEGVRRCPSERLPQSARALQKALLSASPNLLRDRKHFMRTVRKCCTGKELVDSVMKLNPALQTRPQAVGVLQLLVDEAVLFNVRPEWSFQDKDNHFYQFLPEEAIARDRHSEEDLQEAMNLLTLLGPDALLTASLRKPPSQRTAEDLETIYEELLHIKAVSHLSSTVKRQLTAVLHFESHRRAGTVLFTQGDPGRSWYIIWRGSVNVLTHSKGLVTTLHEEDDFGELALVNEAPRSATIVLGEDNCHFLRVDKQDFNRILKDVEANTVRLKEHGEDVLVMEKCSQTGQASGHGISPAKYTVMFGTSEKILEYLLETINLDADYNDPSESFLGDFILTHSVFMSISQLQNIIFKYYQAEPSGGSEAERTAYSLVKKQKIVHLVTQWVALLGRQLLDVPAASRLLEELDAMVAGDSELSYLAKDGVPDKRKSRHSTESVTNRSPQMKLRNSLNWFTSLDEIANINWLRNSTEIVYQIHRPDDSHLRLLMPVGSTVQELISALEQDCKHPDEHNLYRLNSTGEFVELKSSDRCVYTSLSLNERLYLCTREELDTLVSQPVQQQPAPGAPVSLDAFSSKEVANQLTDYDWELFNCIDEIELIRYSFGERLTAGGVTANLQRYLRRFNEIQYWTMSEICQCVDLGKRVRLLKRFIKVAACCKEQRNMNSFFAIMFGLSDSAVTRLSQTWEGIPNKTRRMYQGFERLLDPTRNHRVYRLMATKLTVPFLPFLPLLLKDMTFIQEGNKTFVNNLVNFEKMRMIARVVNVIRNCRCNPHAPAISQNHLNPEPTLARVSNAPESDVVTEDPVSVRFYARHLNVISNQRILFRLSRQLEP